MVEMKIDISGKFDSESHINEDYALVEPTIGSRQTIIVTRVFANVVENDGATEKSKENLKIAFRTPGSDEETATFFFKAKDETNPGHFRDDQHTVKAFRIMKKQWKCADVNDILSLTYPRTLVADVSYDTFKDKDGNKVIKTYTDKAGLVHNCFKIFPVDTACAVATGAGASAKAKAPAKSFKVGKK